MNPQRIYLLTLGSVPLYANFSAIFLPILIMMLYAGASLSTKIVIFVVLVFTIIMHELGHALAARARGADGIEITLTGMGGYCAYSRAVSAKDSLMISLAGPAMNGIIAIVAAGLLYAHASLHLFGGAVDGDPSRMNDFLETILLNTMMWNIVLGIFNILPIYPLDGGQALFAFFKLRGASEQRCRQWTLRGSFIAAGAAVLLYSAVFGSISPFTGVILIVLLSQAYRHLS